MMEETEDNVFKKFRRGMALKDMIEFRRSIIKELFGFEFLMFKH